MFISLRAYGATLSVHPGTLVAEEMRNLREDYNHAGG